MFYKGVATIDKLMENARAASDYWRHLPVAERVGLVKTLRRQIADQMDTLTDILVEESGRLAADILAADFMVAFRIWKSYEKHAEKWLEDQKPSSLFSSGKNKLISRRPHGVTAIFSPWNFPVQLALLPAAGALIAGNCVILKPSELLPNFNRALKEIFEASSLPAGVLQLAEGGADTGKSLIAGRPDHIFFTGGTETGKRISEQAAPLLIPVDLELGGKDAMIVREDANLERAAKAAIWGAFFNSGQACISVERLYVHQRIAVPFIEMLKSETAGLVAGRDTGAMIHSKAVDKINEQLRDAAEKGAKILSQPEVITDSDHPHFPPTLVLDAHHNMQVMKDETFGPVLPVMVYETDDEAAALVNDSEYGLSASIFSKDLKAAEEMAGRLETGSCVINNVMVSASTPETPFGGAKSSGSGRTHGPDGVLTFTRPHSLLVYEDKRTRELNWYPYSKQTPMIIRRLIRTFFK